MRRDEKSGPEVEEVPAVQPMKWQSGSVDYRDATNIGQRLVRMAEHTQDGRMESSQVAARLCEDSQSSQRLSSLARLVKRTMRKHREFREIPRDWFQLVRSVADAHEEYPNRATYRQGRHEVSGPVEAPSGGRNGSIQSLLG